MDDYEAATAHLTIEEDGAYNRLLRLCWRTPGCSVPDDPKWIMRKMRVSADDYYRVVEPLIDEFFTRGMGRVFQARLQQEYDRAQAAHDAKSAAGKKGNAKRWGHDKPLKTNKTDRRNAITKQSQPEPEPEPIKDTNVSCAFSDFWAVWPDKKNKASAEKAWKKLSPDTKERAVARAAAWCMAWRKKHPDASHIHAATYLNQRRFDDEAETTVKASEDEVWSRRAAAIRSGQEWMTRHITTSHAAECVRRGLITEDECRKAGVL